EFFGPHGPALLILVLPAVVYGLFLACNQADCLSVWPTLHIPSSLKALPESLTLFSWEAMGVFGAWFGGLALLHLILPGKRVQGAPLPDGSRLTYKLNGALRNGTLKAMSVYWPHLQAQWEGAMLSGHGSSGYPWYDFWMGRELNPRTGTFDWKEFCEMYPGLIGWVIINLGMAHKQYMDIGRVTNSMVLVNAFQLYYVVDALWNEPSILSTMDITTDGFGYMLAFGDLAWVPFVFSCSSRYLADYPMDLSAAGVAAVLAVKLLGYYIFRGANGQKDTFRRNPDHPSVAHLKTMPTTRGTKLIISGWWGMSRHINYLGDWIMGVAWCMPCGLAGLYSIIPYFYCIYFATLLIHRERRDDAACRKKYGRDWDKYCAMVKYRIVPYVY
ncbi:sterol reductase, partial [Dunaliella salina]